MHDIAMLLSLPAETPCDWATEKVTFEALASRADSSAPIDSRPIWWRSGVSTSTSAAKRTFEEKLKKAVPFQLVDELIKSGVPPEKIKEILGRDDPAKELEKLRNKK